jgi:superfamily II DNA/RNA helicase
MCCVYEGQNIESELYRKLLTDGCDLLIATPTIINDLIQKRHIHFEQLQMIVVSLIRLMYFSMISGSLRNISCLV